MLSKGRAAWSAIGSSTISWPTNSRAASTRLPSTPPRQTRTRKKDFCHGYYSLGLRVGKGGRGVFNVITAFDPPCPRATGTDRVGMEGLASCGITSPRPPLLTLRAQAELSFPPATHEPRAVDSGQHHCETEPSQGIPEVIVRQHRPQPAGPGQATGRIRAFQFHIERR